MHVPIETAREARDVANRLGADCAVAIGGGSTTGLGKAIAMESGLPIIAIPTTYAGSEMTPVYGITEDGLKRTGKDPRVLPKTVIYDSDLTKTLPLMMSITSGMNAIAHAAEGLYRLIVQNRWVIRVEREFDRIVTVTLASGRSLRIGMILEYKPVADAVRSLWKDFGAVDIALNINPNGSPTPNAIEAGRELGCKVLKWEDLKPILQKG